MELFSRRHNQEIKYEFVRRQNDINAVTALALEAHTAIGLERRAAAQQVHDTVQAAQEMMDKAGPHLSFERKQAIIFRVMAMGYELLDITNTATARLIACSRR